MNKNKSLWLGRIDIARNIDKVKKCINFNTCKKFIKAGMSSGS